MRVLEVVPSLRLGGAERSIMSRLTHTPNDVHTVIASLGIGDPELEEILRGTDRVESLTFGRYQDIWNWARQLRGDLRPDCILAHTPRSALSLLTTPSLNQEFKRIVVAHSPKLSESRSRALALYPLMGRYNHRADLHIAVSGSVAAGAWCRNASRTEVSLLGSELDTTSGIPGATWPVGTKLKLLSVGRLTRPKNVDALIRSIWIARRHFRDAGAHLLVAGDGPERKALARLVDRLHIQDSVTLAGQIYPAGGPISEADFLVIAARFEGGPLTAYEAAIAGTPLISTPVGAVPDVVASDHRSIVTGGFSMPELVEAIEEALAAKPLSDEERERRRVLGKIWRVGERSKHFYALLRSCLPSSGQ